MAGELMGLGFAGLIIALIVIPLILGALFLWLALKLVGAPEEKMSFGSVLVTAIINALIPCCLIQWYIIKIRHTDSWGSAIAAWFLSWIIPFLIGLGIVFLLLPMLAA